jgi:hypothetical protein
MGQDNPADASSMSWKNWSGKSSRRFFNVSFNHLAGVKAIRRISNQ